MEYTTLKLLHISLAVLSISGFVIRGSLAMRQSDLLQQRWLKIVPHVNDTLLLITAIGLSIQGGYQPLQHSWLAAKIILLIAYIGLGLMTLRFAGSQRQRLVYFILAVLTFTWIAAMAITKSVVLV